jgi:hypothetical protein
MFILWNFEFFFKTSNFTKKFEFFTKNSNFTKNSKKFVYYNENMYTNSKISNAIISKTTTIQSMP